MDNYLFRCSSIGKLMTEPVSIDPAFVTPEVAEIVAKKKRTEEEKALIAALKRKTLSEGAKTYIRELAKLEIFGIDLEISSKHMEKGIEVESESIALLNRVRGLDLTKNTERKNNGLITGECDLYDPERKRGHDIKSSWSLRTYPGWTDDCYDKLYEWQMRGYMILWDADEWSVDYCMVDTPERLIGYENPIEHTVSFIHEHLRVTSWVVQRDRSLEDYMEEKILAAREYMQQVIQEFDQQHQPLNKEAA